MRKHKEWCLKQFSIFKYFFWQLLHQYIMIKTEEKWKQKRKNQLYRCAGNTLSLMLLANLYIWKCAFVAVMIVRWRFVGWVKNRIQRQLGKGIMRQSVKETSCFVHFIFVCMWMGVSDASGNWFSPYTCSNGWDGSLNTHSYSINNKIRSYCVHVHIYLCACVCVCIAHDSHLPSAGIPALPHS